MIRRTLFWIGLMISAAMAGMLAAASPLIAVFFENQSSRGSCYGWPSRTSSTAPGINQRLLRNGRFHFKSLAIWDVVAKAIGLGCGIVMARGGIRRVVHCRAEFCHRDDQHNGCVRGQWVFPRPNGNCVTNQDACSTRVPG